ncbi:MAG: hydantoinase/oxoprolinase family protein [Gammaproteobacteria bacterium]|nr:MAG: hydantoinase/oxoprolinase family protein [Gammaproteobacteria bacterium]
MKYAMAIDIGGTFTDVVLIRDDGRAWTDKTLTTHHDLLEGFFRAASLVLDRAGIMLADIDDVVVHATTVVTNVLIERKGSPTALLVTEGFRSVLQIRDEHRFDMFDPQIEYAEPLIPRDLTWGLNERSYADGTVGKTVDADEVGRVATEMQTRGVISVAVCLLNSYRNPTNEQAVRDILAEVAPDLIVTLSSDVAPQMREYLRASTTAVNAYAVPVTRPYLQALSKNLSDHGVGHEPLIMLSNGGVVGARIASVYPVRMIESGPAAGALVAGYMARRHGLDNLISFDMGGTTAKACLIQNAEPLVVGEFEVDRQYLFKPGSGIPVTVPSIDMIEIGAGGGSIARVDELGLLKVGPQSAGSNPGPACYARNGTEACVTDADVVLGILDPDNFLGGDMQLDAARARAAVGRLAEDLDVDVEQAAWGIFSVVGESMAAAARTHATDRGVNYRGLPLLAFGGAGPVHACYVAEGLDSNCVIYPPMASVLSAFGTLVTPVRLDLVRGGLCRLSDLDHAEVSRILNGMIEEGSSALTDAGVPASEVRYEFGCDARYFGQQNEVTTRLDQDPRDGIDAARLREQFERAYETLYGVRLEDMDVEIVSWRLTARGGATERALKLNLAAKSGAPRGQRQVYLNGEHVSVPVYARDTLARDQRIDGPVIVEERETTVFVLPGWRLSVHADGSLIADRQHAEE